MDEKTLELNFGGTYKNTPAEVAPIISKILHTYLPTWKYGSRQIKFVFTFAGWKMAEAEEMVRLLKGTGTLHSQFTVSFSETTENVTVRLSLKK